MSNETLNDEIDLLRFTTAGSVDDGKSTLIGRLLYDSKAIFEDQITALENTNKLRGESGIDLALLTDGLRAEREQGITIDVAYRYFATPKRKFIIADTPGHIQYTRNMVTGASTANLAIILVDARQGVVEQTCRHALIASLLRIQHLVICVNKMDLVEFKEEVFNNIVSEFKKFASRLDVADIVFIPISALHGDNVVDKSEQTPWYQGPSLLYHLETVYIGQDSNHVDSRFPVQYVIRPQTEEYHDFRGYAGRVASGVFKPGDEVVVLPSGFHTRIQEIRTMDGPVEEAYHPHSVVITVEDDLDISRGDMIVKPNNQPRIVQDVEAMICWFSQRKKLQARDKFLVRHTTTEAKAVVQELRYKININNLHKVEEIEDFSLNDIGRISLRISQPLFVDPYKNNRNTGSIILVDPHTFETVAAGMLL